MRNPARTLIAVAWLLTMFLSPVAADDPESVAIKVDRERIAGNWRIVELVIDGEVAKQQDISQLKVVNESDGRWTLYSEEKPVSQGSSTINPTIVPKTIDFRATEDSSEGELHLGIYELGTGKRKLCFASPGNDRPTEFASKPGSDQILVVFERVSSQKGSGN